MFGKNKKSVVLLIVISFWVCYVTITGLNFYYTAQKIADAGIADRQRSMNYVQENLTSHLITESYEALKESLEKARQIHFIDFYIVQKNGEVLAWYNNFNNLDGINVDYQNFNVTLETDEIAFRTIKIVDTKLTVGVFQDRGKIIWNQALLMKTIFLQDISIVTFIVSMIVFFLLRDIVSLSKALTSDTSREEIQNIKATSAEAHALINATKGFEGERIRLSKLSETYGETVGPAIRHELNSGRKAPYTYEATMCRVDLNGYTQIFMEKSDKYLIDILNRYFARARDVIERYDGLIYQFVGDEIVFQFKDDMANGLSSQALAAACIRDLFTEAKAIEESLPKEAGHYFKLKASFAHGTMRFTALDEGHALSGLPLIESVRLLSLIDDKSHQIMAFFGETAPKVEGLAFIFDRKVNQLKGFKEESMICRARDFNSIEWVFESRQWDRLAYFRSDSHLLFILKRARLMAVTKRDEEVEKILSALKPFHSQRASDEVVKEIDLALAHFIHSEGENLLGTRSLSALVSLVGRAISKEQVPETMTKSLAQLLDHKDPRVQANAILVLGKHGYPARKVWEKMYSSSNRVAADTIVEVAKQQINEDLMKALDRLLKSPYPQHKKSGEYALRNILNYYQETDPVFFAANPFIERLRNKKIAA